MATKKPFLVIISGAWLPISSYNILAKYLESAGHGTAIASLLSLDPTSPATATIEQDAGHIVKELLSPLIEEQGLDVVLVMHSYGGKYVE